MWAQRKAGLQDWVTLPPEGRSLGHMVPNTVLALHTGPCPWAETAPWVPQGDAETQAAPYWRGGSGRRWLRPPFLGGNHSDWKKRTVGAEALSGPWVRWVGLWQPGKGGAQGWHEETPMDGGRGSGRDLSGLH